MGSKKKTARQKQPGKKVALPDFKSHQEIAAFLPTIECQRKCQQACSIAPYSAAEADYIQAGGLKLPTAIDHPRWGQSMCSALNFKGDCTIYTRRPAICRIYGLVPDMQCPFGCVPSRWLTKEEAYAILFAASQIYE